MLDVDPEVDVEAWVERRDQRRVLEGKDDGEDFGRRIGLVFFGKMRSTSTVCGKVTAATGKAQAAASRKDARRKDIAGVTACEDVKE